VVYAGAIVVLFLFVIMLLGVDQPETLRDPLRGQRWAAIVLGLVLVAEVLFLAGHHWATGAKAPATQSIHGGDPGLGNNVERVARSLFTDFLWPFEITAALLVLAVIRAVVLPRRSRGTHAPLERTAGCPPAPRRNSPQLLPSSPPRPPPASPPSASPPAATSS